MLLLLNLMLAYVELLLMFHDHWQSAIYDIVQQIILMIYYQTMKKMVNNVDEEMLEYFVKEYN